MYAHASDIHQDQAQRLTLRRHHHTVIGQKISVPTEKNSFKKCGVLEEHRDFAWTTEINRDRSRFNEPCFEKTVVLCVLTAVLIVAVIAGYVYRGLHTGNRGISFSGYCRLFVPV